MPASPVEAEATGQEFIESTFRGGRFRLPLDVDSWPLEDIERCVGVRIKGAANPGAINVDQAKVAAALKKLLGDQWPEFLQRAPRGAQLIKASNRFAAAVGVPAGERDRAFGGIPTLLARLAAWPDHVESDLHQFWGIDYRDRWRFDEDGRRRLTLRQIHARLSHPPRTSRLAIALNGGKEPQSDAAIAAMDLWEVWTKKRHPSRPMTKEEVQARQAQQAKDEQDAARHRERQERRQQRLSGKKYVDNARANALRAQGKDPDAQNQAG